MLKKVTVFAFLPVFLTILAFSTIQAQRQRVYDDARHREQLKEQRRELRERLDAERRFERLKSIDRMFAAGRRDIDLSPEITKQDSKAIAIHPDDSAAYKDFLQKKNKGIVRLHDAQQCDPHTGVITASSDCPNNILSKATAFSFRQSLYHLYDLADISLRDKCFFIAGRFTISILADLGEAEMDKFTLESKEIKPLIEYTPPDEVELIRDHQSKFKNGLKLNSIVYSGLSAAQLNHTYVLRVIAFDSWERQLAFLNENNSRKDLTVLFRPIRKHGDDSLTLIWQELQSKDSPKIKSEKNKSK